VRTLILLALGCGARPPAAAPVCQPVLSEDRIEATEGDTVAFDVTCPEGPFELALVSAPDGATFEDGHFTWTTGPADAGSWRVVVDAHHPDAPDSLRLAAVAEIGVADGWSDPANVPVDPLTYTEEWGLPVLHVDTGGAGIGWEEAPVSAAWKGEAYDATIHVRGASSASYPKQSFTLDVTSATNLDLDDEGLGGRDHLVLMTTFDDNSYVRQKLAYDVWADVAATRGGRVLAPRTFFLVLYVDGQYRGIYLGLDRIDDEFLADMGFVPGGNLYKSVNHDANYRRTDVYGNPKSWLGQGFEQKQGTDTAPLEDLVAFAADSDDATFVADRTRIDPAELADWYLWARTVDAGDSGGKNAYLYDDPETGLLRYAPWDLNYSFGQDWMTLRVPASSWNDFRWANQIFVHLQDDPDAAAAMAARYDALVAGPMSADAMNARIDAYIAELGASRDRDWARWGPEYQAYGGWAGYRPGDWTDPDQELAYVRQWIADHEATLESAP
jgi:spore coat protein H